jgi:hypothetical protein
MARWPSPSPATSPPTTCSASPARCAELRRTPHPTRRGRHHNRAP